ncbi:MAG: hypothetical protein RML73_08785 [Anaerolineae bacterium]|nr:hypothetical protein [Anaerolineae bacterium]
MKLAEALIIALLFLCYVVPWTDAESHGLRMNAYDWAEWTSLHPAQRSAEPPLLVSLALRLHLLSFSLLLACATTKAWRWFYAITLVMLFAAQLPPPEFLSSSQDSNYRQQTFLAISTLVLGLIVRNASCKWRRYLSLSAATLSCGVLVVSLPQALALTQPHYAQIDLTAAPVVFGGLYLGYAALILSQARGLIAAPLAPYKS